MSGKPQTTPKENNDEYRIGRLRLGPGDTLVVKLNHRIDPPMAVRLRAELATQVPEGIKILVVDPSLDLSVLTKDEIAPDAGPAVIERIARRLCRMDGVDPDQVGGTWDGGSLPKNAPAWKGWCSYVDAVLDELRKQK